MIVSFAIGSIRFRGVRACIVVMLRSAGAQQRRPWQQPSPPMRNAGRDGENKLAVGTEKALVVVPDVLRPHSSWEGVLRYRGSIGAVALAYALMAAAGAHAFDESKYPDWSGQWRKPAGIGNQWDQTKRMGRAQQPPLTREYQAIFEASLADQAAGGQGEDARITCVSSGMPRMMTAVRPFEFVILPNITYINFENYMPRRIYTDGRDWPKDEEPAYAGYSIGKWIDEDGDGRYDVLEIETRNFKGPRIFEGSGIPLHRDNQSIIKERVALDKANKDLLRNEIMTIDNALTHPWTVTKTFRRERKILWHEDNCSENNNHLVVGKEGYFLSADGYLMPTRKGQAPPDLRYFTQSKQ